MFLLQFSWCSVTLQRENKMVVDISKIRDSFDQSRHREILWTIKCQKMVKKDDFRSVLKVKYA